MVIQSDLKALYVRDLDKLVNELESYENEELLWLQVDGINNSAGNLIMHICGNLQHFVGAILDGSEYARNRNFEFNGRVSIEKLRSEILTTKSVVENYFSSTQNHSLEDKYPLEPLGYPMRVGYFLIHLHSHLSYHLGQINYHRRILSKSS